ncbi:hypothetical protein PAERUG_P54_1_London_24_VIM_2_04_13_05794 [Pseudomonas aeruginosa]|nr:hypothetical protein PAERUG_P54_1_London_24_VIM_2_04_13_05794 [Pseudomonas aeruginosa]
MLSAGQSPTAAGNSSKSLAEQNSTLRRCSRPRSSGRLSRALPLRLSTSRESASSKISRGNSRRPQDRSRRVAPASSPLRSCCKVCMVRRTPARADGKPRMIAKALRNAHPRRARVAAPNRQDHREWNSPPPNANSCWPIAWPCSTAAWCTTPNRRCPPNTSSVLPKAWPDRFQKTCYASGAPVSAGASAMTWKSTTTATATRSLSANCSIRTATATTTSGAGSNTSASWRRKPRQKKAATGTASWPTCRSVASSTWSASTSASNPAPSMAR